MRLLGPAVIRIGGNSVDESWWTGGGESAPAWATSVITPADLTMLHGLLTATGWRAILGVDLGHFDPTRAANETQAAQRVLGGGLMGVEIGNEPNDYGSPALKLRPASYSASDYLKDLAAYSAALQTAAPGVQLYGPDLGSPPTPGWLSTIATATNMPFAMITQHYYPTTYSLPESSCKGTPVPSASELLSKAVREGEDTALEAIAGAGAAAHHKTLISETNATSSCDTVGGPATSPVFASALWALDWSLRAASAGVSGIDFHGYFGQCAPHAGSPVCAPSSAAEARGQVTARPEYYGLLAAAQLEGGRFIPVKVGGGGAPGEISAYATMHAHGLVSLAIDNLGASAAALWIRSVAGYANATGKWLVAPAVSSTGGVTFGRVAFDGSTARAPSDVEVHRTDGNFHLKLPPTSAVVVTLSTARPPRRSR